MVKDGKKIGLYGGTFDPPHHGHLIIARSIAEEARLDKVILIPSPRPPHKQQCEITDSNHRLTMLKLAIENETLFEIDDWEMHKKEICYTIDTVNHFQAASPDDTFYWIIGADSLAEIHTWYCFEELISQIPILTAMRGGLDIEAVLSTIAPHYKIDQFEKLRSNIIQTPHIEISATDIRRRIRNGQSIRYLVTEAVEKYIHQKGLYQCPPLQ
jgi:nicotinate-nucleotide adenylyltransferase